MKKVAIITPYIYVQTVLVFLICAEIAFAQSSGAKRNSLEHNYKLIRSVTQRIDSLVRDCDSRLNTFKTTSKTVFEDGSEIMKIDGYFDALGNPVKLITTNTGSENQRTEIIYYHDKELIFTLQTDCYYPNGIKDKEDFITSEEHRLYFYGNKLIKWIEKVETDVSSDEDDYPSREEEGIRNSIEYLKLLTGIEN